MRTPEQQTTPTATRDGHFGPPAADGARPRPGADGRFFGYPDSALAGTWTVRDLQKFLRISERKARELMHGDGAPPPLRLGSDRCDRWNPYQVVAWLHGTPEAASAPAPDGVPDARVPAAPDAPTAAPAPGRQWSPRPVPATRSSGRAAAARR